MESRRGRLRTSGGQAEAAPHEHRAGGGSSTWGKAGGGGSATLRKGGGQAEVAPQILQCSHAVCPDCHDHNDDLVISCSKIVKIKINNIDVNDKGGEQETRRRWAEVGGAVNFK